MNPSTHAILAVLVVLSIGTFVIAMRPARWSALLLPGLTILLFALPRAGFTLPQLHLPLPVAHGLCALLILEWLVLRPKHRLEPEPRLGSYLLAYATVAGLALAIGLTSQGRHVVSFLELCFYLFSIGLFFYASETFSRREDFLRFIRWILIVSLAVSAYGLAQVRWGSSVLVEHVTYNTGGSTLSRTYLETGDQTGMRVLSSYGDPNVLASQLLVFAGIGLALLLGRRIRGRHRALGLLVLVANVACIVYTGSRAALVGMILVTLVVLCWQTWWTMVFLSGLAGVAVIIGWESISMYVGAGYEQLVITNDMRLQFPRMAYELVKAAPLGCGFGRHIVFQTDSATWAPSIVPAGAIWAGFNSFWLNLLSRLGLAGVAAFVTLLVVVFRYLWRQSRRVESRFVQAALVGLAAGFLGQWFIWLANNTYMLPGGGLNFWFMLGMAVAGARAFDPAAQWVEPMRAEAPAFAAAPMGGAVAFQGEGPAR